MLEQNSQPLACSQRRGEKAVIPAGRSALEDSGASGFAGRGFAGIGWQPKVHRTAKPLRAQPCFPEQISLEVLETGLLGRWIPPQVPFVGPNSSGRAASPRPCPLGAKSDPALPKALRAS